MRCIYGNSIYLENEIVFTTFRLLVYNTQRYHPFMPMLTLGQRLLIHSWLYHSHESFLFFRDTTLTCNTWFFFFCLMTERLSKSTCLKSLAWSLRRRMRGRGIFPWWSDICLLPYEREKQMSWDGEYLQEALMDLLGAWALLLSVPPWGFSLE